MRGMEVSIVMVEHPWIPSTDEFTSAIVYIRWEGDRRKVNGERGEVEIDREEDLARWIERIVSWDKREST